MYTVHCTHFVLLSHCCCCRHRARVLSYKWNTIINARQRIPNVVIPYIFVIWRFFHGIHWIQRELWFCAHSLNVRISFVRIVILSSFQFIFWVVDVAKIKLPNSRKAPTSQRWNGKNIATNYELKECKCVEVSWKMPRPHSPTDAKLRHKLMGKTYFRRRFNREMEKCVTRS